MLSLVTASLCNSSFPFQTRVSPTPYAQNLLLSFLLRSDFCLLYLLLAFLFGSKILGLMISFWNNQLSVHILFKKKWLLEVVNKEQRTGNTIMSLYKSVMCPQWMQCVIVVFAILERKDIIELQMCDKKARRVIQGWSHVSKLALEKDRVGRGKSGIW